MMKKSSRTLAAVAALVLGAATAESSAVTRTYKITADLRYDIVSGILSQPLLEIQNPRANTVNQRVTGVNIAWNPEAATTTVVTGVSKHASGASCNRVTATNAITLAPGEGITINGLESVMNCNANVCGQTCTTISNCPSSCTCIILYPTMRGTCIPFPPVIPQPDRITFEVTVVDDTVNQPASVRSTTFFTNADPADPQLRAVRGGEVDMDSKQR